MPITTISQFPNTDTLNDTDLFLVSVPGVTNKNISWGQMKTLIEGKKSVREMRATNVLMPTEFYVTNFYVTNLFSTTWTTNDFSQVPSRAEKAIESIATSIPKPTFSSAQWGMILFGAIISIICIARIYTALRWNK